MIPRNPITALVRKDGFTLTEFIVCLVIIAVLIFLAMPATTGTPLRGERTQTLSNMKQLHLATQIMALDGTTTRGHKSRMAGRHRRNFFQLGSAPGSEQLSGAEGSLQIAFCPWHHRAHQRYAENEGQRDTGIFGQ